MAIEFRDLKKQYEYLKKDIDSAISQCLLDGRFIGGEPVKNLEEKLAEYVGVKHCISCANGTDALTLALMAWGIGKGDAVFVPDFTFFSSGECPAAIGATPVFVDVEVDTYNIDPQKLEQAIVRVTEEGVLKPKVVVAVDLFGQPADYDRIRSICKKYNLLLLEDGAQGFGGDIRGKKACSFGDISTTSFFPAKPLGCYGDGGAIFTDNDEWAELIRSYAVHGKSGNNKYDNVRIGMNSRLDTIQAAILHVKLKAFLEHELYDVNAVAGNYFDMFSQSELQDIIILPHIKDGYMSSWAQYTVQLLQGIDRDELQKHLKKKGIPTMVYYMKPMHEQEAFMGTYSSRSKCPVTERLCKSVISLPMHPYINREDTALIVNDIEQGCC